MEDFEKVRKAKINKIIEDREITRVCHMTQIENLISIMKDRKICATQLLEDGVYYQNDKQRFDHRRDLISTSIQYPNYWYYKEKCCQVKTVGWAVIFVNKRVISRKDTAFCPINAAKRNGAYIRKDAEWFGKCFAQELKGIRSRTNTMLKSCPTDDQAEVLVPKVIPLGDIDGIAFETLDNLYAFLELAGRNRVSFPALYISPDLFSTKTSNMIRMGKKPVEKLEIMETTSWQNDQLL